MWVQHNWIDLGIYVQSDDSSVWVRYLSPDFIDFLSLFQEWCPNYMLNHLKASMIQNKILN